MMLIEDSRQTKTTGEKPMAGHVRAELSITNQEWAGASSNPNSKVTS